MKRLGLIFLIFVIVAAGCAPASPTPVPPTAPPVESPTEASSPTAAPQATATNPPVSRCASQLTGRVQDASGKNLTGAIILVQGTKADGNKFEGQTVSDDNGLYGFAGLCAGTYGFTVTPKGGAAQKLSDQVKVDGSNRARQDLKLK
jgi:protocatechuate 3,4-dioxygenase beta subunit